MQPTRRGFIATAAAVTAAAQQQQPRITRYVRFRKGSNTSYGILNGDVIRPITGDLLGTYKETSESIKASDVKLLYPMPASKVLAVGLNYRSHLGSRTPPSVPEMFYKPITCLQHPGDPIVIPADSKNTHYEGELVIVMGKRAAHVSEQDAANYIFGVTCGNDVSERDWQNGPQKDLQWWRAKGADTFGPCGPVIARGLDYGKLQLRTRVNGKVVQEQSTSDLLFNCHQIVSFVSKYVSLMPGDLIYTGTPGTTSRLSPGDTVEVDIEGVGVLRNPVASARG